MLIQSAERRHRREIALADPRAWWPYNAVDIWWRAARRAPDPELLALRMLDGWRAHATWRLSGSLFGPEQCGFIETTNAQRYARCLDKLSVSALVAFSFYRKLRANHGVGLFRVVRTDTAETDAWPLGPTLDIATLLTHAGSSAHVIKTAYDQSGNSRDYADNGPTTRPRIVNAGVLDVNAAGKPSAVWDGTNDTLFRADALGLSGSPALTSACVVAQLGATSAYYMHLGGSAAATGWRVDLDSVNSLSRVNTPGSQRSFTTSGQTNDHAYIAGKAASATVGAYTLEQDGVALNQQSVLNTGTVQAMTNSFACWGSSISSGAPATFLNMRSNFLVHFNAVLSGNDLEQLRLEMLQHM